MLAEYNNNIAHIAAWHLICMNFLESSSTKPFVAIFFHHETVQWTELFVSCEPFAFKPPVFA